MSSTHLPAQDDSIPKGLRILFVGLAVIAGAVWFVCLWLGMFLLAMANTGSHSSPSVFAQFDFRHILTIVLITPLIGALLGLHGIASSRRGSLTAGTAILGLWLAVLVGWFVYNSLVTNGPTAPGNWSDRYFRVTEADRIRYRMSRYDKVLVLKFSSPRVLLQSADAGTGVPMGAQVEIGTIPPRYGAPKEDSLCSGKLRATRFEMKPASEGESLLGGNFFGANPDYTRQYMSGDRRWLVDCGSPNGRCTTLFANDGVLSQFLVEGKDVCRAPEMNRRLMGLARKWVR